MKNGIYLSLSKQNTLIAAYFLGMGSRFLIFLHRLKTPAADYMVYFELNPFIATYIKS